jgi:PhnB protein
MAFHPYLYFGGNCREAFTRYQEIFGGELVMLRFADMPAEEPTPTDQADLVMHAALTSGDRLLMGSDDPTGSFSTVQGMSVSYSAPDAAEATRAFEALAEGGKVTMPLGQTFFSPSFGMCVDRFGTPWMVVAEAPEPSS